MGLRIWKNLCAALPLGAIFGFWLALAEGFRVVFGSVKLLRSLQDLTLVLTYGCITTLIVILILTLLISIIASIADKRGNLNPQKHAGCVVGILTFLLVVIASSFLLGGLSATFHPLDPRFIFPVIGVLIIGWLLGRLTSTYAGRTYEPSAWPLIVGNQYAIATGLAIFIFGTCLAQFHSMQEEIYSTGFATTRIENLLYYPLIFIAGAAVWAIMRTVFKKLSTHGGVYVLGLIALIIIIPLIIFMRPAEANDPDKHNPALKGNGRNVILISIDTLRYDSLGCNGNEYIKTPNIDALAAESVIFDNCTVSLPLTVPSHTTMLTGLNPRNHGLRVQNHPLDSSVLTLAQRLSEEGFTCGGFISMVLLKALNSGLDRGFHYYDDYWIYEEESRYFPTEVKYFIAGKIINKILTGQGGTPNRFERRAEDVIDSALKWLDYAKDDDFFCFLHFFDPHWGYNAPEPYTDMYDPDYDGELTFNRNLKQFIWNHELIIDQRDIDYLKARYDGEVTYTDSQLGKFFNRLKVLGLWDKTMIILTSDHGESFEHDYFFCHADRVYQSCIHVPLLIKPFGGASGERRDLLCTNADFFPTICEALNLRIPDNLDGKSLSGSLHSGPDDGRQLRQFLYSESYAFPNYNSQHYGKTYTIIKGSDKLIYSPYAFPYAPIYQLYNIQSDPNEEYDLFDTSPNIAESLTTLLQKWVDVDETPKRGIPGRIEQENLRSLHYLN